MIISSFEINKLYVLGNGFDLHHGIRCSYKSFKSWLFRHRRPVYNNLKRLYRNINQDWWSTFEENLANFNPDKYPLSIAKFSHIQQINYLEEFYGQTGRDFIDSIENDDEDIARNQFRRAGAIARFEMQMLKEDLNEAFGEWVLRRNKPKKETKINTLDENAIFFTFNYTKTLETLYEIDDDQVVHLHGSVDNKEFIIGHNMTAEQMQFRDLEKNGDKRNPNRDRGQDDARMAMFEVAEEMKKPVQEVIVEHGAAFNSLAGIKEIEILGLSYSPIDLPYLKEILSITGRDIKIILGWHCSKDKKNAVFFAEEIKLKNWELKEF